MSTRTNRTPSGVDYKFFIGIAMLISGCAMCLSFSTIIIGLPILLGGVISVGISRKILLIRLLTIIGTFVIWFPIAFYGVGAVNKLPPKIYLIPENFKTGHFRVVFESKCGVIPKEENGKTIVEIPQNGILSLREEYQKGDWDAEFYFVDKNGKRTRIQLDSIHRIGDKNVIRPTVYYIGIAGTGDRNGISSGSRLGCIYHLFLLYNRDSIIPVDLYHDPEQDALMDSLTEKLRWDFFSDPKNKN